MDEQDRDPDSTFRVFEAGADGIEATPAPALRFSDAVGRWDATRSAPAEDVVRAACQALVEGLDSPALRDLAGCSVREERSVVEPLVTEALGELGIARRGELMSGYQTSPGGGIEPRPGTDRLRLEVAPASAEVGGFELLVYVNDVEMTSQAAGMGMDPYDVLVPDNRLLATGQPRRTPIARCSCGEYGCGVTDISIVRDGVLVHWEWLVETPMNRGVSFVADAYDAEVARAGTDHRWETPDRAAGRLILERTPRDHLAAFGLKVGWVSNDYRNSTVFTVCLHDSDFQVFVAIPWQDRTPEELADVAVAELSRHPRRWRAQWHSIQPRQSKRPPYASRRWSPYAP